MKFQIFLAGLLLTAAIGSRVCLSQTKGFSFSFQATSTRRPPQLIQPPLIHQHWIFHPETGLYGPEDSGMSSDVFSCRQFHKGRVPGSRP